MKHCSNGRTLYILHRMKLSHKLLVILVGFTCLLLALSLALARWSFEQGFTEFIHEQERERLTRMAQVLVSDYQANNNSWANLSLPSMQQSFSPPPRRGMRPRPNEFPPPRHQADNSVNGPPTLLFDAAGGLVSGDAVREQNRNSVIVDLKVANHVIGKLVSYPPEIPESAVARAFSAQQLHAFILIGLISFAVSLMLALGVIPRLINPFKDILNRVKGLTARQYDVILPENRRDEFGELMRHINTLGRTLDAHEKTKSQWLADISHELRTPLTILSGEIELIKAGLRPLDNKQLASFDQEVARLSHLVEDLYQLSLSDIGGLAYHFTHVNVSQLIRLQCESMAHLFESKGLVFTCTCPSEIEISADPQRLKQLLVNILVNACEYTDTPGKVVVFVMNHTDSVTLTIEDSAPGITKGNDSMLFEPLFREDASRQRRAQGAGLGLSISKQIVEAHSGTINASASSIGGVKLTIELPKTQPANPN